ncbi:type II secretion system F family protein [Aquabacterium sp. A3]|uniref:type II secretion system F family protein n=1 Tax=Aquabacterium sp. A3 TaxID=3132829 RepID=UPI00311A74EE
MNPLATSTRRLQSTQTGPSAQTSAPWTARLMQRQREFPRRLFCQELAVLLDAGIPLYEALQTLKEKEGDASVALVLARLCVALSEGQTLAQAMRVQPEAFTTLLVASIEAAQRTGQLTQALRQHAAYLAWVQGLRDKLVGAAIYPVILIGASLLVIVFLTVFVVPRFAEIYDDMGGELPWLSGLLLQLGRGLGEHPMQALMGLVVVLALAVWAARQPAPRQWVGARLWQAPVVGERLRLIELASLYRTLGLLLQAGVPVVSALGSSAELMGAVLRPALDRARQRVAEGQRLSEALQAEQLVTPVSVRMVRVGEQTGELGPMLERAAHFYDEELARFTDWVGKVVNPVLMLVMGVVIGGIVVLMYLPIFQVAEQIQ